MKQRYLHEPHLEIMGQEEDESFEEINHPERPHFVNNDQAIGMIVKLNAPRVT
jgi:hypothetical protein